MPNQGTQSHSTYPEHVEQVRQKGEVKGSLTFATGKNWCGRNKEDEMIIQAGPHSWFEATLFR